MLLSVEEIVKATNGKILNKGEDINITRIDTDSRNVTSDSLFIPLKGDRFDGHDFILNVIEAGCRVVLSEKEFCVPSVTLILVKDTKIALGDIARYYIKKVNPKRIAITGSVGKTTTKDMVAAVCEQIGKTTKTKGNFNNDIGVPVTAFNIKDEEIAIFEMGMNHFGEIEYLSGIVKPSISVITNIGYSHIENLGSREGILQAKLEITKNMDKNSFLILNGDNELLYSVKDKLNVPCIYYGIENKACDILAYDIKEENGTTSFYVDNNEYKINVLGIHNVYNALSAVSVGSLLTKDEKKIRAGLINFKPEGIRQNIVIKDNYKLIIDCYNAAPDSMLASLEVLKKVEGKRKIAVFGSVAELGDKRDNLLYEIGTKIAEYDVYKLITVSPDALAINKGARDSGFMNEINLNSNTEVIDYLKNNIKQDDVILIKGSRKYKMEEISEGLMK